MEKIIVLGIGNRLMMDDGIGIYIVDKLMEDYKETQIDFVIGESDIDYCLEQLETATFVIIIDAVILNKVPGEVSVISLNSLGEHQLLHISPHNQHLFEVLLQQKENINGFLLGIEPFEVSFYIGLSPILKEKFSCICKKAKDFIGETVRIYHSQ